MCGVARLLWQMSRICRRVSDGFGWHTTRTTLATPAYLDWRARLNELESLVH